MKHFKPLHPDIIKSENQHLISRQFLIRRGIDEASIDMGIEQFLDGKSSNWNCLPLQESSEVYLSFNSLPTQVQESIDSNSELAVEKKGNLPLAGGHVLDLMKAFKKGAKDFQKQFNQLENEELRNKYARKYAVMLQCMNIYFELGCKRGSYKKIYECLRLLKIDYYKNQDSFNRAFRGFINSDNFAESVLHKAIGKPNIAVQRLSDWHILKITDLLGQGHSRKEITRILKKVSPPDKVVKYSSVCRAVSTRMKNITAEKRYGYDFFKKHLEPYILRQKPEYKLQVVEADATRFQIPYVNDEGKMRFLKMYAIIDTHSSLILGFSLFDEETTDMAIEAFFMMFEFHHMIPSCAIVDKSSAHTSHRFKQFKEDSNRMFGTLWREHLPDYPNAKGTIENFFLNFHTQIVKRYFDYLGLSFAAKSDEHRINRDKVKYLVKHRDQLRSKYELIQFCGRLISEWNDHITKDKSPTQKFNESEVRDAQLIDQSAIARLCWHHTTRKVSRSKIDFSNNEYSLEEDENRLNWNGEVLDVYYHPKIEDFVFLFKGDELIEKVLKKRRFPEESGSKFNQIKRNKSYRKFTNEQYLANKKNLETAEMDDPLISMYYEESKENINDQFSTFLEQQYNESHTLVSDDPLEGINQSPKSNLNLLGYESIL